MKISKSGPEYTKLVLMQEPEWEYCKNKTCLNVGVETLKKLFDYEDILKKYNIEQSPEGLEQYIQLAEKGIQCLKIAKDHEETLRK